MFAWGIAALLLAWLAHYRLTAVRAPRLDFDPSPFNEALLARVDMLRRPYAPTPWLYNAHLQLAWLLLCEAVAPRLRYERTEVLRMRDGGTTALDWLGLAAGPATPTLVVLPSITGDAQSMRSLVRDLHRATGWRIVVCARRGHGDLALTAPVVNTMGCTHDLREQLARIAATVPDSPCMRSARPRVPRCWCATWARKARDRSSARRSPTAPATTSAWPGTASHRCTAG